MHPAAASLQATSVYDSPTTYRSAGWSSSQHYWQWGLPTDVLCSSSMFPAACAGCARWLCRCSGSQLLPATKALQRLLFSAPAQARSGVSTSTTCCMQYEATMCACTSGSTASHAGAGKPGARTVMPHLIRCCLNHGNSILHTGSIQCVCYQLQNRWHKFCICQPCQLHQHLHGQSTTASAG